MNTLLNFFRHYWITATLIIILLTLIRQSFYINEFPFSLYEKQAIIDKHIEENTLLQQQNDIKSLELQAYLASDGEVLESQARYRLGLVKKGERYYQISERIDNE
ncbi:MAG: Cell division protein FtsB [Catillopecten margaritatus gill symbiont]|uniref:Cell division protein FtsB n=1 Tax=Catillopecten margaritatus gill symbiont TaxID=3083288 RepID=A0AAU6PFC2_9GAMM